MQEWKVAKAIPWAAHIEKISEIFEMKPENFFTDESNNLEQENTDQKGGMAFQFVGTINTINSLSEKLIEQYEERIEELKQQVDYWRNKAENKQ